MELAGVHVDRRRARPDAALLAQGVRSLLGSPANPSLLRHSVSFFPCTPPPVFLLLLKAFLFLNYLYLFCLVIRKESPRRSSLLPAGVALGRPRVPACVARSKGPGPCLPSCPPAPTLSPRPLEIEAQELEAVLRPAVLLYSTGGGGGVGPDCRAAISLCTRSYL